MFEIEQIRTALSRSAIGPSISRDSNKPEAEQENGPEHLPSSGQSSQALSSGALSSGVVSSGSTSSQSASSQSVLGHSVSDRGIAGSGHLEPELLVRAREQKAVEQEIGRAGGERSESAGVSASGDVNVTPFFDPIKGLAAVALVLSGTDSDLSMCFIKRADREGDPWSGHMAFPGGRASASDPSPRAVAERETEEEVGLVLNREAFLGELAYLPVRRLGVATGMTLYPFVYYIGNAPARLLPSDEVANAFWIPLEHLWQPQSRRRLEFEFNGQSLLYPAIRYGEYDIWGLTYRVLTQFSEAIGRPLPSK